MYYHQLQAELRKQIHMGSSLDQNSLKKHLFQLNRFLGRLIQEKRLSIEKKDLKKHFLQSYLFSQDGS